MLSRSITAFVLFCIISVTHAERLIVCHVKGEIYSNGVPIRVGTELEYTADMVLEFSSLHDEAIVVSPEKGRYLISAIKYKIMDGIVRILVRDNLLPCPILRPSVDEADVDIVNFHGDGRLSLLDSIVLPLNKSYFNTHPDQYFILTYRYEGETMQQRIVINPASPSLTISNKLFAASGEFVDPSMVEDIALYLHDAAENQSKKLSNLQITSLLNESTVQELRVLVNGVRAYTNDDQDQLLQEVRSHIEEVYGHVLDTTVLRYLRMLAGS